VPDVETAGEDLLDLLVADNFGLGEGTLYVYLDYPGCFHISLAVNFLNVDYWQVCLHQLTVVLAFPLQNNGRLTAVASDILHQILPHLGPNT
jgi:hypothetical protein